LATDTATIVAWNPAPRRQFTGSHQFLGLPYVYVLGQVTAVDLELLVGTLCLLVQGQHRRRQPPGQAEGLALGDGERRRV
jgi:hypothetical protein